MYASSVSWAGCSASTATCSLRALSVEGSTRAWFHGPRTLLEPPFPQGVHRPVGLRGGGIGLENGCCKRRGSSGVEDHRRHHGRVRRDCFRRKQKRRVALRTAARVLLVRGSRRLVLPDQSAQFPQEQHRLTAPWRLLLAGRCGTEAGVRLGRRRLLSGKAWQAGASREVNVPVEEKVPLVVLLVRVAPLSSWLTGLRQRPAARGAAASFPGLPPPYRDGETAAIGARGF